MQQPEIKLDPVILAEILESEISRRLAFSEEEAIFLFSIIFGVSIQETQTSKK